MRMRQLTCRTEACPEWRWVDWLNFARTRRRAVSSTLVSPACPQLGLRSSFKLSTGSILAWKPVKVRGLSSVCTHVPGGGVRRTQYSGNTANFITLIVPLIFDGPMILVDSLVTKFTVSLSATSLASVFLVRRSSHVGLRRSLLGSMLAMRSNGFEPALASRSQESIRPPEAGRTLSV